jgi:hypothetical protein
VFHDDGRAIGEFRKTWQTACKKASLTGIIVHELRRTAVRNMVRPRASPSVLRWNSAGTRRVFDLYNIVNDADRASASELLQSHFGAQPVTPKVTPLRDRRDEV